MPGQLPESDFPAISRDDELALVGSLCHQTTPREAFPALQGLAAAYISRQITQQQALSEAFTTEEQRQAIHTDLAGLTTVRELIINGHEPTVYSLARNECTYLQDS